MKHVERLSSRQGLAYRVLGGVAMVGFGLTLLGRLCTNADHSGLNTLPRCQTITAAQWRVMQQYRTGIDPGPQPDGVYNSCS